MELIFITNQMCFEHEPGGEHPERPDRLSAVLSGFQRAQLDSIVTELIAQPVDEELVFYEVTTGAGNDLEQATSIAKTMITRLGMSKKLGPRTFGKREELVFLGKEISEQADYSDNIAQTIDEEVHGLLEKSYTIATDVIKSNMGKLTALAEYLLEHETIEGDKLKDLLNQSPSSG